MNPFLIQAEMAKAWLGLATSMTSMALDICTTATRQAGKAWSDGAQALASSTSGAWPTLPGLPMSGGTSGAFPWLGAMPGAGAYPGFGALPAFGLPAFGTIPGFGSVPGFGALPGLCGARWPWPMPFAQPGTGGMAAGLPAMPWMQPMLIMGAFPIGAMDSASFPWMAGSATRNPASDMMDQVAASYRSASGYAVAAVIAPMAAATDAQGSLFPWWPALPPRRRDVN